MAADDTDGLNEKKVDEAWKNEAKQQKRVDAERAAEDAPHGRAPLGEASFMMLLSGLATQVILSLGQMENPITHKKEMDLEQAKYTIDLLQVLEEKTKGNLTDEEKRYLDELLYDLRMCYVVAER